jgi:hypothetical protein
MRIYTVFRSEVVTHRAYTLASSVEEAVAAVNEGQGVIVDQRNPERVEWEESELADLAQIVPTPLARGLIPDRALVALGLLCSDGKEE